MFLSSIIKQIKKTKFYNTNTIQNVHDWFKSYGKEGVGKLVDFATFEIIMQLIKKWNKDAVMEGKFCQSFSFLPPMV